MSELRDAMLVAQEDRISKRKWPLSSSRVIIGRAPMCDLQINDRRVSRRHAEIRWTSNGYTVRDLGSTNGTLLNGCPLSQKPRPVCHGDKIEIACCLAFVFLVDKSAFADKRGQTNLPSIKMDLAARRVWINDVELVPALSPHQYRFLEILYKNAGQIVSRDKIVAAVWPAEEAEGVSNPAISALARRLRSRIAAIDAESEFVEAVRGSGFRLNLAQNIR